VQEHEREQTHDFGFWKQIEDEAAEADGFAAELGSGGFGGIALVENQINDEEDRAQALL
jgi:hypothetical protein